MSEIIQTAQDIPLSLYLYVCDKHIYDTQLTIHYIRSLICAKNFDSLRKQVSKEVCDKMLFDYAVRIDLNYVQTAIKTRLNVR
jgi:hypothetical protein